MPRVPLKEKYRENLPRVLRLLVLVATFVVMSAALGLLNTTPRQLGDSNLDIPGLITSLGWWRFAAVLAVVLAADTAVAHFLLKLRGLPLVRSLAQTATLVLYSSAAFILPAQGMKFAGDAVTRPLMAIIAVAATCLFGPVQAFIFWIWSGTRILAGLYSGSVYGGFPSEYLLYGPEPYILAASYPLALAATGMFALFVRRVLEARRGARHVLGRLALAASAILAAMALAGLMLWGIAFNQAVSEDFGSYMQAREWAENAASNLVSDFTPSEIEAGGSTVASEVVRYSMWHHGLTIYDLEKRKVIVAVRFVRAGAAGRTPQSWMRPVTLSATETALIEKALPSAEMSYTYFGVAAKKMIWPEQWEHSGDFEPESRFILVATPGIPGWADAPVGTGDSWYPDDPIGPHVLGFLDELIGQQFPVVFVTMLLLVCVSLLILERRDRATAKLLLAQERARMSRDAHDRVYNRMTALASQIEGGGLSAGPASPAAEIRGAVEDLQRILGDVDQRAAIAIDSGARLFDDLVADQADRWSIAIGLSGAEVLAELDPRVAWELQCVVEEALTNAGRHAHASLVTVTATRADGRLRIVVADDGCGLSGATGADGLPENAHGLRGVADRMRAAGGTLSVEFSERGTTLTVEAPV